jgi:glutathione S-transferase
MRGRDEALHILPPTGELPRARIALNLKGIAREDSFLHLEKGDQFADAYRAINPQMVVPTLIGGDIKLLQSLAILEYLEEAYSEPPLLPADPLARAWVRGLALINVADSHPLIVPRARRVIVGTGGKRLRYQRPASEARTQG